VNNTDDGSQLGNWIKWENGYFYTNNKYTIMDRLNAKQSDNFNNELEKTIVLNSSSEITEEHIYQNDPNK